MSASGESLEAIDSRHGSVLFWMDMNSRMTPASVTCLPCLFIVSNGGPPKTLVTAKWLPEDVSEHRRHDLPHGTLDEATRIRWLDIA